MTKRLIFLALLLLPIAAWSQGNTITVTAAGAPTGTCAAVQQWINSTNGDFYTCNTSTNAWHLSASAAATCDSSGNCTINNLSVTGTQCNYPGATTDGSTVLYKAAKPSAGTLVIATTGDTARTDLTVQTADNTVCTSLTANHGMFAHEGDVVTLKADAIGLTDGDLFGLSGVTAATWKDLGANTAANIATLTQPYCGVVQNGGAVSANATFTGAWKGCKGILSGVIAPASAAKGDLLVGNGSGIYTKLAGNASGTKSLLEASDGTASWGSAFDPNDTTIIWLRDEFSCFGNTSGSVACLGWNVTQVGAHAPAAMTQTAGTYPNLGLENFPTASASVAQGDGGVWVFPSSSAPFGNTSANTNWQVDAIYSLSSTASIRARIGLGAGTAAAIPNTGMYARYDTSSCTGCSDTTWKLCVSNAGTETCVDTTAAVNTNFAHAKLYSVVAGTVRLQMYTNAGVASGNDVCLNSGGTGGCTAATIPTANEWPEVDLVTDTAAQKVITMDFYGIKFTGVAR